MHLTTPSRKQLQRESELGHNQAPKQAQNSGKPDSRSSAFCRTNYSNTFLSTTKFSGWFSFLKHLDYCISGGKKGDGVECWFDLKKQNEQRDFIWKGAQRQTHLSEETARRKWKTGHISCWNHSACEENLAWVTDGSKYSQFKSKIALPGNSASAAEWVFRPHKVTLNKV